MENQNWILEDLNIRQDWNKKGLYVGNCKFKNGVKMEVSIMLDNQKCSEMIGLLQKEIVASATQLGDMLVKSMPVALPVATETNTEAQVIQ